MYEHFLCPKPKLKDRTPFIPAVPTELMPWVLGRLVPAERKALEAIVECADILTIDGDLHLILPARPELLDALAAYASEGEEDDRDNDNPADRQAMSATGLPYNDEEPDYDNEPEDYSG